MRIFVPILAAILLVGGGCAVSTPSNQSPASTNATSETELKAALEQTYGTMVASLQTKDFDAFTGYFSKKDARLTKELFLDSQELLNKLFKPLDQSKFITAYRKGDKAYMIRETYLNDPNFISIEGQIYDYKDGKWFIGEFSTSDSVSKDKENPSNDQTKMNEAIAGIKKDLEEYKPGQN